MGFYTERGYTLAEARLAMSQELESWYGGQALDVFNSSATGVKRVYVCDEAAQLRMINGKVSNTSITLSCGAYIDEEHDPQYEWLEHTSSEAGKVHTDYVQFSKSIGDMYNTFKAQTAAATTVAEVDVLFAAMQAV